VAGFEPATPLVPHEVLSRTILENSAIFVTFAKRLFAFGSPDAVADSVAGRVGALRRG